MTDTPLIALVSAMDRCWLEGRFDDLAAFFSEDVVVATSDGRRGARGRDAVIESYRELMSRSRVDRFEASGFVVTERADAAVVEYAWSMAWESGGTAYDAQGREVLALARDGGAWRVFWRMQLPGADG